MKYSEEWKKKYKNKWENEIKKIRNVTSNMIIKDNLKNINAKQS